MLLAFALVWLFLSLRQGPIHIGFIVSCLGIGVICGGLIILDFWKHPARNLIVLPLMIFLTGPMFLNARFFPGFGMDLNGKQYEQYLAIVVISSLIWIVALRHWVRKHLSQADVEHVVGPERR